jgi:hypothetical protein
MTWSRIVATSLLCQASLALFAHPETVEVFLTNQNPNPPCRPRILSSGDSSRRWRK